MHSARSREQDSALRLVTSTCWCTQLHEVRSRGCCCEYTEVCSEYEDTSVIPAQEDVLRSMTDRTDRRCSELEYSAAVLNLRTRC